MSQARFECVECGFEENADLVGAINMLRAGHARLPSFRAARISMCWGFTKP
ncbi:zinc ribbon domain-containing protein [Methylomonas sp. AM2-LC]|uniref:zinc ribbon domain-containing protein n=1 Tax=Methylomonas sp. AM2-LC TaxID=3153301 RepID=UPI003266FAC7